MTFLKRQNHEGRKQISGCWEWGGLKRGIREFWGAVMELFYILIVVAMVTSVYELVKTHRTLKRVFLLCVNFTSIDLRK